MKSEKILLNVFFAPETFHYTDGHILNSLGYLTFNQSVSIIIVYEVPNTRLSARVPLISSVHHIRELLRNQPWNRWFDA